MALRYALLGLLAERPRSGYALWKTFENSLANVWPASHSQIYPELARLREDGLIEQVDAGARGRKSYAATPAGVDAVRTWLRTTEPDRATRDEAMLRVFFLWLLEPEEAAGYLRDEAAVHAAKLAEYEAIAAAEEPVGPKQHAFRLALEAGIRYRRMMIEWTAWAVGELETADRAASRRRVGRRLVKRP